MVLGYKNSIYAPLEIFIALVPHIIPIIMGGIISITIICLHFDGF